MSFRTHLGRKLSIMLAALFVFAVAAPTASAHWRVSGNHYYGYCNEGTLHPGGPHGVTWNRNYGATGQRYIASSGTIVAQRLDPCLDGDNFYNSKSLLLAANLDSGGDPIGSGETSQLGIGKVDYAPGLYQCSGANQMVDQDTEFIWTPNADQVFCRAWWVDFNDDGVPDNPIWGRAYRFEINVVAMYGTPYFDYVVKDLYTGLSDHKLVQAKAWSYFWSWWGCETGNHANQLGTTYAGAPAWIRSTAYKRTGDVQWLYTENSPVNWGTWGTDGASYWGLVDDQSVLGEQKYCYTTLHNSAT